MWINHVAIYGNDIDEMFFFYSSLLGFKETERVFDEVGNVRMIRFQISESQSLEIFNFNSVKFAKKSEYINRGFMHVGFAHNNVYEIREWLKSNNVEIQTDIRVGHDGLKHFFVEDPEKNLIEFTEVK